MEEVIRLIDCNAMQRVCVVDQAGRFLGLISDRDLLAAFSDRHPGIWDYLVSKIPFTERGRSTATAGRPPGQNCRRSYEHQHRDGSGRCADK